MKLGIGAVLAAAATVAVLHSQTVPEGKGREVANKVVTALGGQKFLNMHSRLEVGHTYGFFHDQLSGPEVVHAYFEYTAQPAPNGLAVQERELLGKKQDYSYL